MPSAYHVTQAGHAQHDRHTHGHHRGRLKSMRMVAIMLAAGKLRQERIAGAGANFTKPGTSSYEGVDPLKWIGAVTL